MGKRPRHHQRREGSERHQQPARGRVDEQPRTADGVAESSDRDKGSVPSKGGATKEAVVEATNDKGDWFDDL